ncbi:FHA domain-containing protein [Rhizomonospora bruguierae]|uniref:FHA domain-containing protein n=1 Tax=Rhizomonospora bruguierae TaxID=1581705 RepID=UPI001BCFF5B0|nr:FHA domain-containing protein [Micromonospora sp. NBRC 107566]
MRFEVSKVLDAIERRLSTDPALARGVVDLAEIIRYADLDNGRPASVLRLGLVVDALARYLAEENIQVYAVVDRRVLSDADLTSNERMVVRRWADDGQVEVVQKLGDRLLEVAGLTGLPVVTRVPVERLPAAQHPWLLNEPGRLLAPVPGPGGIALVPRVKGPVKPATGPRYTGVLARLWHCSEGNCPAFGEPGGLFGDVTRRPGAQPPPRMRQGVPTCPRHDSRLKDAGPRPPAEALVVRVDGVVRTRFVVGADGPVVVGRAPTEQGGVMLGPWLSGEARRWVSRSHVRFDLRGGQLTVTDVSTNGTSVLRNGSDDEDDEISLNRDDTHRLGPRDVVEPHPGVEIARPGQWASGGAVNPSSVMAEAPTMAMKIVPR